MRQFFGPIEEGRRGVLSEVTAETEITVSSRLWCFWFFFAELPRALAGPCFHHAARRRLSRGIRNFRAQRFWRPPTRPQACARWGARCRRRVRRCRSNFEADR